MEQNSFKERKSIRKTVEQNPLKRRKTKRIKQNPSSCCEAKSSQDNYRWRNLPNDILDKILYSILGFPRNVITISDTSFDMKLCDQTRRGSYDMPHYWNILTKLFALFTSPSLKSFHLHLTLGFCQYGDACSIINSWPDQLRRNNVQHFKVTTQRCTFFDSGALLDLTNVFQIHSLVSLDLDLFVYGTVASTSSVHCSVNLPNLKKLRLTLLVHNYKVLEWLVVSCPTLEDLSFTVNGVHSQEYLQKGNTYVREDESISVLSKSLKRLCITLLQGSGDTDKIIIDAPNLVHFDIAAHSWSISSEIYAQMFDSISHVKTLVLDIDMWTGIDSSPGKTKTVIFPNATHLTWVSSSPHKCQDVVLMLQSCPNLEVLVFKQGNGGNYWKSFYKEDIIIPLEQVKRIELLTDTAHLKRKFLSLARRLLRSAPLLEKLILSTSFSHDIVKASLARDIQKLLKSPRLSPHCEIEFLGGYESHLCQKD